MGDENSLNFDLRTLLAIPELDIHEVATNNPTLLVENYYYLLLNFTQLAPRITSVLAHIIANKSDKFAPQSLVDIMKLLSHIGCKKLISPINDVLNIVKNNESSLASMYAEKIIDDFNVFYTQIMAAKKEEKTEAAPGVSDSDKNAKENASMPFKGKTLRAALEELNYVDNSRMKRILVVDDSPVIIKTVSSILRNDYKVSGITNPAMLKGFLFQVTPDLFLLDYKMPKLSGFELIPIIRGFREHKNTPIIFLTSMGTTDHISTALSLGACDFVVKPFQPDILREKIIKHMPKKRGF